MFNTRMVIIFLWVPAYAQDIRSWYAQHKTARAYQEGDIQTAHTLYTDLVKENPQDALVNFNEGFLLYKQGDYPHAAASFERAAQQASSVSGEQQQEIYFNLGNAKAYQKEWQQAIDAYDKVLEQNPDHERAQHNKEIVRKLREQEKQQQKKEQQQKQKDKQDKQKEEQEKNNQKEQQQPPSDDQQEPSPKEKEKTNNTPEQQGNQQQGQENKPDNKGNDTKQAADEHKQERSDQMNKNKEAEEQKAQEQKHTTPSSSKDTSDYKTSSAGEQAQDAKEQDEIGQLLEQVDKKDTQQAKRLMQVMLAQTKGGQYENKPSW